MHWLIWTYICIYLYMYRHAFAMRYAVAMQSVHASMYIFIYTYIFHIYVRVLKLTSLPTLTTRVYHKCSPRDFLAMHFSRLLPRQRLCSSRLIWLKGQGMDRMDLRHLARAWANEAVLDETNWALSLSISSSAENLLSSGLFPTAGNKTLSSKTYSASLHGPCISATLSEKQQPQREAFQGKVPDFSTWHD